ncbi:MAG: hypothetical protein ACOY5B_16705 [Spirochaetota bacterium]
MRFFLLLIALLAPLPLLADTLECLAEGTVEQIAEHLPKGSLLYRDCYHCRQPAYEVIVVEKTELRPCHMHDSETERALYVTGKIQRRFQMEKCGELRNPEPAQGDLLGELVVLNYSWIYDAKTGEATNIADMFGENSHHLCKRFTDRPARDKKKRPKKSGG